MNKKALTLIIILALCITVYLLPFKGLEEAPRRCLVIFAMAAMLWITEIVPLYVTGFVILLAEVILLAPIMNVSSQLFYSPFFSNIIALFLGGFVWPTRFTNSVWMNVSRV